MLLQLERQLIVLICQSEPTLFSHFFYPVEMYPLVRESMALRAAVFGGLRRFKWHLLSIGYVHNRVFRASFAVHGLILNVQRLLANLQQCKLLSQSLIQLRYFTNRVFVLERESFRLFHVLINGTAIAGV